MVESPSPIALFVFRRPGHTKQVLDSLAQNDEAASSVLYIYCDGAKAGASPELLADIAAARRIAHEERRFRQTVVIERDKNLGLASSIIAGVTEVVERHGTVIVVEDDLVLSRHFLAYMNDSLRRYEHVARVGQIGACNFFACGPRYPRTFFAPVPDCWGWATWRDRWRHFDPDAAGLLAKLRTARLMHRFNVYGSYPMDRMLQRQIEGAVDSWAIRWQAVCVLRNWLILYPNPSMSNHVASLVNTHTAIDILPPLATVNGGYDTIAVTEDTVITKAMRRGYAGIGNSDGTLNLGAKRALLRYLAICVPGRLLAGIWRN